MAEDNVKKIRDLNDFTSVNPMTTGDHLVVASSAGAPATNKATIKDVVGLYLESSSGAGKWSDGTTAGNIYYNGGNVGIGTTSPDAKLHIPQGSTIAGIDLSNACILAGSTSTGIGIDDNEIIKKQGTNGGQLNIGSQGVDASIKFKTGADTANGDIPFDRMVINSDGNVGIGTTEPEVKLHVDGPILSAGQLTVIPDNAGITLDYSTNNSKIRSYGDGAGGNLRFEVGGIATSQGSSEAMCIDSDGNVGIGTTNPGAKLDIAGDDEVVHSRIENTSIDASSFAASVINGHLAAILQLTSRSSGTDTKSFNIASQGGRLTIDVISDDGQTSTRLMDIDASGNLRIKGTLQENSSF